MPTTLKTPPKWLSVACLSAAALAFSAPVFANTVDLKVLVISTGTAQEDQGLDLIDDMLDQIGTPYDVFDATKNELTADVLSQGDHGNYNGIILTDSFLYYTGAGNYLNSALSLQEWQTLHAYERDFKVREAVISGHPVSGDYYKINYDLDYGMDATTIEAGSSYSAVWNAPAGQSEVFEYVNTANPLPITDYARAAHPMNTGSGPAVTPLLTDAATGKAFVSEISYEDGRKVLLSTITNAWYLVHSQILNYEFLNYATQGVFIGARKVYLEAHVDDLFLADELWDPDTNTTTEEAYRNTGADIDNLVLARSAFDLRYPKLAGFKLDMVFNGGGAAKPAPADSVLTATDDTYLNSRRSTSSYGSSSLVNVVESWRTKRRGLIKFSMPADIANLAASATLNLTTRQTWSSYFWRGQGKICLASEEWNESANWVNRISGTAWASRGGSYDAANCVSYTDNYGNITADITSLVNRWQSGAQQNFGLLLVGTNGNTTQIYSSEASTSRRPKLTIKWLGEQDDLTDAVVQHKDQFRFINHTLTHTDMYKSAGATYDIAKYEIGENLNVWQRLGLPGYNPAYQTLVTGNHSGLEDSLTSYDGNPTILQTYPEGHNPELMKAAGDLGVKYLASDSSRVNQDVEALVPGTNILLLPRYPTSVFYNVINAAQLTDEYNYIFYQRHVDAGQDPCSIAGAICSPRTYEEILQAEADTTLRHMLTYRPWPHYFHASNLADYGSGSTLQYDWLNAVADRYSSLMDLPVINMAYYDIGVMTEERLGAKAANVRGYWDRTANTIVLTADSNAVARVTGAGNGELYGGQRILKTSVGSANTVLNVDQALNQ